MKTILCFGNPYIKGDSIAIQLAKELNIPNYEFIKCTYPDEIYNYKNLDELFIMDVVKGVDKVRLITNLDKIRQTTSVTPHDFDLSFVLKLMEATGQLKSLKIIAIPLGVDKKRIKTQVEELLSHNNS
jgi:Ni,Fe-hydrogenase maturation factor